MTTQPRRAEQAAGVHLAGEQRGWRLSRSPAYFCSCRDYSQQSEITLVAGHSRNRKKTLAFTAIRIFWNAVFCW